MAGRLLVVDDEKDICELIEYLLTNEGYTVITASNGKDAIRQIDRMPFDLAILDVMLPDIDGFALCQYIRKAHRYPIIMLTAKMEPMDKVTGLTMGADDYMTKPFLPLELLARVKAHLRRYKEYNAEPTYEKAVLLHRGLMLNIDTQECTLNDEPLALTRTEFCILQILCENEGSVVSAESLFKQIWNEEYYNKNNNTIAVHIRRLREKMDVVSDGAQYIRTVWGRGYKID